MSILSINHEHLSINKMVCLYSWGFFTWKLHHQGHGVRKKRSCSKVVKQQFPKTILKCVFSEIWVRANHWLFPLIVTHFGWFWGTPMTYSYGSSYTSCKYWNKPINEWMVYVKSHRHIEPDINDINGHNCAAELCKERERFLSKRFGALQEELAQLGFQVTISVVR